MLYMDWGLNFQNLVQGQLEPVFYGIMAILAIWLICKRSFPVLLGTMLLAGLCGAFIIAPDVVVDIGLGAFKKVFQ